MPTPQEFLEKAIIPWLKIESRIGRISTTQEFLEKTIIPRLPRKFRVAMMPNTQELQRVELLNRTYAKQQGSLKNYRFENKYLHRNPVARIVFIIVPIFASEVGRILQKILQLSGS